MTTEIDPALRPVGFDNYIGQRDIIAGLRTAVRAAKRGGWQLDHQLIVGPAGLGKTSIALVIGHELGARVRATCATAIEHKGQLAALLTSLGQGDVLFIDEIHTLKPALQTCLLTALEDGSLDMAAGNKVIRLRLPAFTLIGATTHAGQLSTALRDRFGSIHQLQLYSAEDLATIITAAAAKLAIGIDAASAIEIGKRGRGTPRLALRLLRRVRDYVMGAEAETKTITAEAVTASMAQIGVDTLGLGKLDRAYLRTVLAAPLGVEAIASQLGEQRTTIEEAVEPFLVQAGLVARTKKGRAVTEAGKKHLEAN